MKLSIVVPIYKVESYLRKCVDSLLAQDLSKEDYEIILVDDGSPDRCGDICDEYASKYGNIRVIHRKNGGLSAARNSGIKVAQGKYIQFVDSDDYLEPNVLKALAEKMERDNLDILRFNYQNVDESYQVFDPNKCGKLFVDYRDEICDGITFLNERLGYACYAVQFMLRTDLVKTQPLFKEGICFEDVEWTPRVLAEANRVTSVDLMVYDYLARIGSISKAVSVEKKRKSLSDRFSLIESLKKQMIGKTDQRWFRGMISSVVISLMESIIRDFYKEKRKYVAEIKSLDVFPLSSYHLSKMAVRKMRMINASPYLYCVVMKLVRL